MAERIRLLEREVAQKRRLEEYLKDQTHELEERVKELRCLYGISKLVEQTPVSIDDLIHGMLELIPPAWQYPGITVARIILGKKEYVTSGFRNTPWSLSRPIMLKGERVGTLEVCYTEKGRFLKEERDLLEVIAERLGGFIEKIRADEALRSHSDRLEELVTERTAELISINDRLKHEIRKRGRVEEALRKREKELEARTANLKEVNTALKVLLKQRERDKSDLEEKVLINIRELILPYLEKIKRTGLDGVLATSVEIIEDNLATVISPLPRDLTFKYRSLTPTEIQVANLIKHGHSTKELSEMLGLSVRTIETHRKNIRRKLGIRNKRTNLRTHLLGMEKQV